GGAAGGRDRPQWTVPARSGTASRPGGPSRSLTRGPRPPHARAARLDFAGLCPLRPRGRAGRARRRSGQVGRSSPSGRVACCRARQRQRETLRRIAPGRPDPGPGLPGCHDGRQPLPLPVVVVTVSTISVSGAAFVPAVGFWAVTTKLLGSIVTASPLA